MRGQVSPGTHPVSRTAGGGDDDFIDTNEYDDDRTHNVVNELTGRDTDDNGTDNFTLVYDKVGNLTDDNEDYEYVYDVWGRLVEIDPTGTGNVVAKFEYNGLHHRTLAHYDTDTDGDVDTSDTKLWLAYNERWQLVATFEDTDSTPKEEWIYHNAGASGLGSSSYIDDVIMRDRNAETSSPNLEERTYFCQNWRHDVVALVTDTGKMLEWVNYTSYGIPFGLPAGDTNSDGDWDSTDDSNIQTSITYNVREDAELDGDVDSADITHANSITGGYQTLGWNVLSSTGVKNYKGYAGYEWDRSAPELYHVRNRVLNVKLGRWTRRDPLGYVDSPNLVAAFRTNPISLMDPSGLLNIPIGIFGGGSYGFTCCTPVGPGISACARFFCRARAYLCRCPGGGVGWATQGECCITVSVVFSWSVRPGCYMDTIGKIPEGGATFSDCPTQSGCKWRGRICIVVSGGIGKWTVGCRFCFDTGQFTCGLQTGFGTGVGFQACYTCTDHSCAGGRLPPGRPRWPVIGVPL